VKDRVNMGQLSFREKSEKKIARIYHPNPNQLLVEVNQMLLRL
jgi:hypothetical protein